MKVKRFSEAWTQAFGHGGYNDDDDRLVKTRSKNLSKKVFKFIENLYDSVNYEIINYICDLAEESGHDEYNLKKTDFIKLAESKNLNKLKEYELNAIEISKKEEELKKLNEKNEFLYQEASSELVYSFQEFLLENDFDSFYKYFMVESDDIHPDILTKYKEEIKLKVEAKKYNL
jgi:hypothetical protein